MCHSSGNAAERLPLSYSPRTGHFALSDKTKALKRAFEFGQRIGSIEIALLTPAELKLAASRRRRMRRQRQAGCENNLFNEGVLQKTPAWWQQHAAKWPPPLLKLQLLQQQQQQTSNNNDIWRKWMRSALKFCTREPLRLPLPQKDMTAASLTGRSGTASSSPLGIAVAHRLPGPFPSPHLVSFRFGLDQKPPGRLARRWH